jgi:hypothetical protein
LNASGGELELDKCFWYLLTWKWDKYGTPSPQSIREQNIEDLKIKMTTTNTIVSLEQKDVYQSHKTLGTHKCIIGKEVEQYQQLLEKSEKIAKLATSSQ